MWIKRFSLTRIQPENGDIKCTFFYAFTQICENPSLDLGFRKTNSHNFSETVIGPKKEKDTQVSLDSVKLLASPETFSHRYCELFKTLSV